MNSRGSCLVALIVLAVGVALRLHGLDLHDAWADEGISWAIAQSPDLSTSLLRDTNYEPPLFQVALHAVARLDASLATLRALPAAFGVMTCVVWVLWLRRRMEPWPAALAAPLVCLSAFQVFYSQELRAYSLEALLGLAVLLLLLEAMDRAKPPLWLWVTLALVEAAQVYAHYLAVAYLLAIAIAVPFTVRLRRHWRPWLISQVAAALLFLPWAPHVIEGARTAASARLIVDFSPLRDSAAPYVLLFSGRSFSPGISTLESLSCWASYGLIGLVVLIWVAGGARAVLRGHRGDEAILLCFAGGLSVTIVVLECLVWVSNFNYIHTKYVIWAHAPVALLAAAWFQDELSRGRKCAVGVTLFVFIAVNAVHLWNYKTSIEYRKAPEYREAASWLERHADTGDALLYDWIGTCQAMDPVCASSPALRGMRRGPLEQIRPDGFHARLAESHLRMKGASLQRVESPRVWFVLFHDWRRRRESGFEQARQRRLRDIQSFVEENPGVRTWTIEFRGIDLICVERR